jgi:hypothetical protein
METPEEDFNWSDRPDLQMEDEGYEPDLPEPPRPARKAARAPAPAREPEQQAYDLDDAQQVTIGEARLKLEQARLYEMLIQFDLFGDVNVHPEAVDKVRGELKDFLVDRLEVLLGMKDDDGGGARHFTSIEIRALKEVARKITDGYQTRKVYDDEGKPSGGLRKLQVDEPEERPARVTKPAPAPAAPKPAIKPVPKSAPPLRKVAAKAPPPPTRKASNLTRKSIDEMSEDELIERNAQNRTRIAKSESKAPKGMPAFDQEVMLHQTQQSLNPSMQNFMMAVANAKVIR